MLSVKAFLLLLCIFLYVSSAIQVNVKSQLFPVPQNVSITTPTSTRTLSKNFMIKSTSNSDVVTDAINRYTAIIQPSTASPSASTINVLNIAVDDSTPTMPTLEMDVSYTINVDIDSTTAAIHSKTPFGALYGLETFSQMVDSGGVILGDGITIQDAPAFRHRGLTIDVGRRIAPIELLNSIIDGLSYSKMNVLHMSLSGPAVRVETETFPELTAWLEPTQFYTKAQIQQFVERARLRGVIIIPEIDIPAHASGFFPLTETKALSFCDADRKLKWFIFNDIFANYI